MTSRTQQKFGGWHQHTHVTASGPFPPADFYANVPFSWIESIITDDTRRGGWRKLIALGGNATTSAVGQGAITYSFQPGRIREEWHWRDTPQDDFAVETRGDLFPISPASVAGFSGSLADLATAKNRALSRLYSDLAAVENAFKGMVFTGELRESLTMIKNPAKILRQGVDDYLGSLIKRKSWPSSRRRKREIVASTWLEYAYGWKPLVADIDSGIEQFYASKFPGPIFKMVRGHGIGSEFSILPDSPGTQIQGIPTLCDLYRRDSYIVKLYGVYASNGRGVQNLHSSGWNPVEFVPTLWELIPYSFLVDYFTNVGDIISSWAYRNIGLNFLSQTTVNEVFVESTNFRTLKNADQLDVKFKYMESFGSSSMTKKSFVRTPSVDLDIPSLELEVPGMSSTKWLNIAALATNLRSARNRVSQ